MQLGKEKGKQYCNLVFFTNFFCNVLADPISFGLIPMQKFLTSRVRRNFQILAALLRSALGATQPEAAQLGSPDVLRDVKVKLEQFLENAIKSKSIETGDSMDYFCTSCFLI